MTTNSQSARKRALRRWENRIAITVVVLAVFAVAGFVGHVKRAHAKPTITAPRSVEKPYGMVARYGASTTITVYLDARDPASAKLFRTYQQPIERLMAEGAAQVSYVLVNAEDRKHGGTGSVQAANAVACAQDKSGIDLVDYLRVLTEHQPKVTDDAFADHKHLDHLARHVKKLDRKTFQQCVKYGTHTAWVKAADATFWKSGPGVEPAIQVNGQTLLPTPKHQQKLTPKRLIAQVEAIAKKRGELVQKGGGPYAVPTPLTPSQVPVAKPKKKHKKKAKPSPSASATPTGGGVDAGTSAGTTGTYGGTTGNTGTYGGTTGTTNGTVGGSTGTTGTYGGTSGTTGTGTTGTTYGGSTGTVG